MTLITETTLDRLTNDSVSVLKQQYLVTDSAKMQVGENLRMAFDNSSAGKDELKKYVEDEYYNAVMLVWNNKTK